MAVRHGCSFTGVLQLLQNVNFYDSKSRGSKKCCPINKMISYVIVKKITLKWTLQPALLFHPVLRWSNFSSKQDSLGSTSLGEVSRLQPAEEIGLKLRIGQNKPLLFFSPAGGWILQSSTPPPPSMTCMSPYFLTSVSAGLKMLYHKIEHFCGNKDVLGPFCCLKPFANIWVNGCYFV